MAERLSPNRLLILWSTLPDEYARTLAPAVTSCWVSVQRELEVALPADPPPPKPTAEEVPVMNSTAAAYEAFRGIDELMGEADEFIDKAKQKSLERTPAEPAPIRVEYKVTLRKTPGERGTEFAFAVGFADTVDREELLPCYLVMGNDPRAGTVQVRDKRPGGPGKIYYRSMSEYCALIDDLRRVTDEFGPAADLPLPDGYLAGTRLAALLPELMGV